MTQKADDASPPAFQVLSFQPLGGDVRARRYQKRKTHAKSRAGCLGCKVKRVKCDEAKPRCRRCQRSNAYCEYNTSDSASPKGASPEASLGAPGFDLITCPLTPFYYPLPFPPETTSVTPHGTPRAVLLHHFCTVPDLQILGCSRSRAFIDLGRARPHLLDAMLAVAACHLRHHAPSPAPHRVAEHFQQSLAIRSFQAALDEPLDQSGSDALLATCMMLNMLAFELGDADPARSWVFSRAGDRLAWFSLQLGLKPLLMATQAFRGDGTILGWMFRGSDDDKGTFNGEGWSLNNVPRPWLAFCGLRPDSPDDDLFHEPLRILAELRGLEPSNGNILFYLGFFGKLDIDFRHLLEAQDPRALWIMGFWFGLLCRFDSWWINNRAQSDHQAIIIWLRDLRGAERGGHVGAMWEALMRDLEEAPRWNKASAADGCRITELELGSS